jgi:hypothetical protein
MADWLTCSVLTHRVRVRSLALKSFFIYFVVKIYEILAYPHFYAEEHDGAIIFQRKLLEKLKNLFFEIFRFFQKFS